MTARTGIAAVIGDPVAHSLSPVLHNAAYRELGADLVYVAFEISAGRAPEAIDAAQCLGLVGLSVTMPHKQDAAQSCDRLSRVASRLRSVNTVTFDGGIIEGDSTDGEGFLRSLRDFEVEVRGRHALVLGAGGGARAVALALEGAGASVVLSARRADQATDVSALLDAAQTLEWENRDVELGDFDLLVNATPAGMAGADSSDEPGPVDVGRLRSTAVVADLVYQPRRTRLLEAAAEHGLVAVGGLGMLVHQAALQVERWTGEAAPVAAMALAVEVELAS